MDLQCENKCNTLNVVNSRKNLKIRVILEAAVIGAVAGIVMVLNRVFIEKIFPKVVNLYGYARENIYIAIGVFLGLAILGYIVGLMVKKEPMIGGSGIPQVEGILLRKFKVNWLRVLVFKFLGGTIGLGVGLSLGREGPSVQMGASIGQGFSKLFKRINIEDKFLITSGAAAGISGAFNAPLSGVVFALEEVHKNFSPLVLLSAMSSSIVADFVVKQILNLGPEFKFSIVSAIPLQYYWTLPLLGILIGCSGVIFCKGILYTQDIYEKLRGIKVEYKVIIPFLLAGIIGIFMPKLLGGGHSLITSVANGGYTIKVLMLFLIIKFIFTIISFGSSTPGGIFFPLLVLGAIVGDIFGIVVCRSFGVPNIYIINFIILAMAAHFASIVKAPITGIILITEMTGSFDHLLALTFVVIIAYITSDLLKSEPIYESLLERRLEKKEEKEGIKEKHEKAFSKKTLLEVSVFMGSEIENRLVKEIEWPENCLIIAIKRGDREIIPWGGTQILAGDYIVGLVNEDEAANVLGKLQKISSEVDIMDK